MRDIDLYSLSKQIRTNLGDKRTCKYALNFVEYPPKILIIGKVDTLESFNKIKEIVDKLEDVELKIDVMEEHIDSESKVAIVKSSTCDMKSSPDFRSSNVHQLIFGESAWVLDFSENYVLAKDMRTGFVGWLRYSNLVFTNKKTFKEWKESGTLMSVKNRFSRVMNDKESFYLPFGVKLPTTQVSGKLFCEFPNGWILKLNEADVVPSSEVRRRELKDVWKLFLGTPYLWGGTSTYGVDCSGFVGRLYDYVGIEIPRDSDQQMERSQEISEREIKFGDLAFFPGHVAFYIGNGEIAHANLYHGQVGISNLLNPKTTYEKWLKDHLLKIGKI